LIQSLKRKYGASVPEVIAFGEEARRKLQHLEQRDAELDRLNGELQKLNAEIWRTGQELSVQRRNMIPKLAKAVMRLLSDLGFSQSHFDVTMETLTPGRPEEPGLPLHSNGLDTVEFQFAPNPGEPARPLRAIASSGEIARVMFGTQNGPRGGG